MIAPRYNRNMRALAQLLHDAQKNNIRVVTYIAPIRQDLPIPYDRDEYETWKSAVSDMAKESGATLINLETLVPPPLWGNYHADDIDFMHFSGRGHQLLAKALLPYVKRVEQSEL